MGCASRRSRPTSQGTATRALELLSVNDYDIAVLDRDIPGPTGDEIARRIVASGSGHADPHAHRRRPSRRQGHRVRARRRRLPHQAVRAPRARAPPSSARPAARPQPATGPRDRRPAPGPVPPRGLPRRPLRRAHPQAVRRARGPRRCRGRRSQRRGAAGAGVGRERRPVHQRRAHHGLGAAQAPRRARDHRHRARRRLSHRRRPDAGAGEGTVARAPGPSVRLKLTLSYAGFLMVAGVLLLAVVWVFLLRYVPDRDDLRTRSRDPEPVRPARRVRSAGSRRRWRSCWCSVSWEGGSSPAGCSPR